MLNELVSWMSSSDKPFTFSDQMITSSVVMSEHRIALDTRQKLIARLRVAHISHDSPASISALAKMVEQNDVYINFIEFCASNCSGEDPSSLFLLALKFLLLKCADDKCRLLYEEKINIIFCYFLKENKDKALDFYRINQREFSGFFKVNIMVDAEKTTEHFAQLKAQLSAEEKPLSIVPLFTQCIDDTEKFAAVMLWLLDRGLPVERIIQTNLLQNFMLYNAAWLDSPDSPVRHLYTLLNEFPLALDLIDAAGRVQFEERGFHCEKGGTHSYAITGTLCEQSALHRVAIVKPLLDFTPTRENYKSLYKLFGTPFLTMALTWAIEQETDAWHAALHECLNNDSFILTELPALINLLGSSGPSPMLKTISTLLDEATLEKLITGHNGAVLHLLSYRPTLSAKISTRELEDYLREMRKKEGGIWDNIPQLLAVLSTFKHENPALAALAYEAILDEVIQHPELLEDSQIMSPLKNFHGGREILIKRGAQLQSQFDDCISAHVSAVPLTEACYHAIEDTWLSVSRSFEVLNAIAPVTSHYPSDKYKLQAYLVKVYVSLPSNPFVLDDFAHTLDIAPDLLAGTITAYERLLIELLTTVDDETLRRDIIGKFEAQDAKRTVWMQQEYGESAVFDKAVQQGNIGLLHWLEGKIVLDQHAINHAVMMAAECQQWEAVNYFCSVSLNKPHRHVLRELLNLAAKAGQVKTVQLLCESAITHLDEKVVEPALIVAAINNHREVVRYLCTLEERPPCAAVVAKALKKAILHHCPEVIDFMGNLPETRELLTVVTAALYEAITNDNLPMVQRLCGLHTNNPDLSALEKAFLKAIQFGNLPIAQFMFNVLAGEHHSATLVKAMKLATANKDLPTIAYLGDLINPRIFVASPVTVSSSQGSVVSHGGVSLVATPPPLAVTVSSVRQDLPVQLITPPEQIVLLKRAASMEYVEIHRPLASPPIARGASCSTLSALVGGGFFSARERRGHPGEPVAMVNPNLPITH